MKSTNKPNKLNWSSVIILVAVIVQTVFSFCFIATNFNNIPAYGDTNEYIQIADSYAVDSWRGVLYPFMLKSVGEIYSNYQTQMMYMFQLCLCLFSLIYFALTLRRDFAFHDRKKVASVLSLYVIYVFTSPIVTHFNLTILTDSSCASFSFIFATACYRIVKRNKPRIGDMLVTVVSFLGASLLRPEKLPILAATAIIWTLALRFVNKMHWKKLQNLGVVLAVCVAITTTVQYYAPKQDYGRPQLTVIGQFINEIGKSMPKEDSAQYFSEELKQVVQLENGQWNFPSIYETEKYNFIFNDENDYKYAKEILKTATLHYPIHVLSSICQSIFWNLFTPFLYFITYFSTTDFTGYMSWTYSRMAMWTPRLTKAYLDYSLAVMFVFFCVSIFRTRGRLKEFVRNPLFSVMLTATIMNAGAFGAMNGRPHVRYMLPQLYIWLTFIFIMSAVGEKKTNDHK